MFQNSGTTSLVIALDNKGILLVCTPTLACHLLQILQVVSCTFILPGPHVGMLSLLEYNGCAHLTIDNITIVTQP
jgi:hypothetical protein